MSPLLHSQEEHTGGKRLDVSEVSPSTRAQNRMTRQKESLPSLFPEETGDHLYTTAQRRWPTGTQNQTINCGVYGRLSYQLNNCPPTIYSYLTTETQASELIFKYNKSK